MGTGVLYAKREEGLTTAVIDVTNPAFTANATDQELDAMAEQYVRDAAQQREIPEALRGALRNSMLGRGLMAASGGFLDAMTTYLLKLGPENLGPDASLIDQRIAASFPAFAARLRLQDMARLLADGLARVIPAQPNRPVCLVNIAGGTGADSWNALLLLLRARLSTEVAASKPESLLHQKIAIAVLDPDARGPAFGERAVAALTTPGAPLSGLNVAFQHFDCDWSKVARLSEVLAELHARGASCGISSEGGLFEYGSDEEIVANLKAFHAGTAQDAFVVGSVTRDAAPVRASLIASRILTRPRTLEAFSELCQTGGWRLETTIERPFSYHVRMVK